MSALNKLKEAKRKQMSGLSQLENTLLDSASSTYQMTTQEREDYLADLQFEERSHKRDVGFSKGAEYVSESEDEQEDTNKTNKNQPRISKFFGVSASRKPTRKVDAAFSDDEAELFASSSSEEDQPVITVSSSPSTC
ncbi:hypothetical protein GEMRC1_007303 [Eukaryota sp. GEM-RC1]